MISYTKRGNTYHMDSTIGGRRVRASLGTPHKRSAEFLTTRISLAVSEGPKSDKWGDLRLVLPPTTYKTLAANLSVSLPPDIAAFEKLFKDQLDRRETLKEIAPSTRDLYERAADHFFNWLSEQGIQKLESITPALVEKYLVWRSEFCANRPQAKNGAGLNTDNTVLAAIFELAAQERLIEKSPFKGRFRQYGDPQGAQPFTPEEMEKLEAAATGEERRAFLLFKWTGLRGSDAAAVTWGSVDFLKGVLTWKTLKRGNVVTIPLAGDLLRELSSVWRLRLPEDTILPNTSRAKLYSSFRKIGGRAGVEKATPHRFRDTLAVTLLEKGGTIYDVAKILGDAVTTVEKHYAPFTDRLQDRVRKLLEAA